MASPVYGKQYIRFAETGYVPATLALHQFRVVCIDSSNGATEPPTLDVPGTNTQHFGVLQQDVPAVDPDKATTGQRLGTVATSGLLLVEADDANPQAQGDLLGVNSDGVSASGGTDVKLGSSQPVVRQVVTIGDTYFVLASFD